MPRRTTLPKAIHEQVTAMYTAKGFPAPYILHRTSTLKKFIGESPHNLLPSERKSKDRQGWTVYLAFESKRPELSGLHKIIAFADQDDVTLPRQGQVRLGRAIKPDLQKADLDWIPAKYVSGSLAELEMKLGRLNKARRKQLG